MADGYLSKEQKEEANPDSLSLAVFTNAMQFNSIPVKFRYKLICVQLYCCRIS